MLTPTPVLPENQQPVGARDTGVLYFIQGYIARCFIKSYHSKRLCTRSLTTAFTIFAAKVIKERRIPFDITADPDPFYSEANMSRLKKAIADATAWINMQEHELIEVDDD